MADSLVSKILVFAALGGIVALLAWMYRAAGKRVAERRTRIASAHPGRAKIMTMYARGVHRGQQERLVCFELEVTPQGGAPYAAQSEWFVDAIEAPHAQPGQEIEVKIDALDATVIYPAEGWATLP